MGHQGKYSILNTCIVGRFRMESRMQPLNNPEDQKAETSPWALGVLKEHYGWISAIAAAIAPFAGFLNLLIYTHYIGRADVFMSSLEIGPGVILLWLAHTLFFVLLIGSMLITSVLLAGGLSEIRPKPEFAESVVRRLTLMTVVSMLGVIIPAALGAVWGKTASLWWVLGVFLPPVLFARCFFRYADGKLEERSHSSSAWRTFFAYVGLIGLIGLTALFAVYPAWMVTVFYQERGAMGGWGEALLFCFVAMACSLVPAIGYHALAAEGPKAQRKAALIGIVMYICLLMLIIPSVMSVPSVAAVKFLGISDRQVKQYLINSEEYPARALDAKRWSVSLSDEKKYLLQGFSLYDHGSVVLLCPADLAKIKESEIDQHSAQCIPFESSAVKPLNGVIQEVGGSAVAEKER
jgi:MFS family permease